MLFLLQISLKIKVFIRFWNKKQVVDLTLPRNAKGTRVELVCMDDPYTRLKPGDRGTVDFVDDTATVHVKWDCGSGLGVAYGVDKIRILEGGDFV